MAFARVLGMVIGDYVAALRDPSRSPRGPCKPPKKPTTFPSESCLFYADRWLVSKLPATYLHKKTSAFAEVLGFFAILRRERDSNPRNIAVQRFSRPPQSTTLPSLQYISPAHIPPQHRWSNTQMRHKGNAFFYFTKKIAQSTYSLSF